MTITNDVTETINERLEKDTEFAKAFLDEVTCLLLNGEPETARLILKDLVNATIDFEKLTQ